MKRNKYPNEKADEKYKTYKETIQLLLEQITAGLEDHDRKAALERQIHWGHVGDLGYIESRLTEIRDFLYGTGEYEVAGKVHKVFNRKGDAVNVVVPE